MTMTTFKTVVRRAGIIVCLVVLAVLIASITRAYADTSSPVPPQTPLVDSTANIDGYDPSAIYVDTDPVDNSTFVQGNMVDPMADTVNSVGVNVSDVSDDATPDALGNYRSGCQANTRRWTAREGSYTVVGHLTQVAHRCWNRHGHLVDGTRITQQYDRTTAAILMGYHFSGQGTVVQYSDGDLWSIDANGHAQLCPGIGPLAVCGFDEQFTGGAMLYSPHWLHVTGGSGLPASGVDWSKPGQRYDSEKGYHLSFVRDN